MNEKCPLGFEHSCEECYYKLCEDLVYGEEEDYDIEVCDFTGEQCFGDKMFCEECEVVIGD